VAVLILTVVATFLITPAFAADKPIKWKAQALWSAAELSYKTFVDLCARIKVLTNGRLEITPYPAGADLPGQSALPVAYRSCSGPDGSLSGIVLVAARYDAEIRVFET